MKKLIAGINNFIVQIVLFFSYFLIIGIALIVKKINPPKKKLIKISSHWLDPEKSGLNLKDFESAY